MGGGKNGTFMFLYKLSHLIEKSFWELLEALSTHKTLLMVQLAITVYDLLSRCKPPLAALTGSIGKGIGHVTVTKKGRKSQINLFLDLKPKTRMN